MTGYVIVQAESPETIGRNFRNPRWGAGGPPFSGHVPISMWDVDVVSAKLRNDFNVFRKIRRKHPTLILAALFLRGGPRPGPSAARSEPARRPRPSLHGAVRKDVEGVGERDSGLARHPRSW